MEKELDNKELGKVSGGGKEPLVNKSVPGCYKKCKCGWKSQVGYNVSDLYNVSKCGSCGSTELTICEETTDC